MCAVLRIIVCVFAAALASSAAAQNDETTLAKLIRDLGQKSFAKKSEAIDALVSTGDRRVVTVLEAMLARNLFRRKADGAILLKFDKDGKAVFQDPLNQAAVADTKKLKKVRINNKLRKKLRGVIGSLSLQDKDPAKRVSAADAVFKSRVKGMSGPLQAALDTEPDDAVRDRMRRALGAIQLVHSSNPDSRIAAINTLGDFIDRDVRSLLNSLLVKKSDGVFAEPAKRVRDAAAEVLHAAERSAAFWDAVQNLFQGISLGSVLLLAAIGLAITFGVMGVINMAHGEMVMLGAYTTFVVQEIIRTHAPYLFDVSLFIAIPSAFLVAGLVGVAIERSVIQFLYGRALETLLATWGISLVLQQFVRSVFGPTNREVGTPSWMQGAIQTAEGLTLTYNRIAIIIFSLVVLGVLLLVLRKTWFGLQMRAVTQNRSMSSAMGIRTGWVDAMTFGLGSGIAGIAGVALSQIDNVSPNLGQTYIIDSFLVVVFGGVGNLLGTLVGALSLGVFNKFLEPYAGAVLAKILVLVVVILFIQRRPRGLFALKGRAVEN